MARCTYTCCYSIRTQIYKAASAAALFTKTTFVVIFWVFAIKPSFIGKPSFWFTSYFFTFYSCSSS